MYGDDLWAVYWLVFWGGGNCNHDIQHHLLGTGRDLSNLSFHLNTVHYKLSYNDTAHKSIFPWQGFAVTFGLFSLPVGTWVPRPESVRDATLPPGRVFMDFWAPLGFIMPGFLVSMGLGLSHSSHFCSSSSSLCSSASISCCKRYRGSQFIISTSMYSDKWAEVLIEQF